MKPIELIDHLFNRLAATYGAAWDRSLGQAPINDVKTVWLDALSHFLQSKEKMQAIKYGLENLPDRCPNVMEFRTICRQMPIAAEPLLPLPPANPERVAVEMQKLSKPVTGTVDHKAWAKKIVAEYAMGIKRTPTIIKMAQDALR